MARVHFVKKARKDNPAVKKGDSYYWWTFRYGGKHYSKTPPRPSQLTQSEFLSQAYELEERIGDLNTPTTIDELADLNADVESITDDIRSLGLEQSDKLYNMPDSLQDGDVGQLLQQRADDMEEWASELEAIDFDYDEDSDDPLDEFCENVFSEIEGVCPNIE